MCYYSHDFGHSFLIYVRPSNRRTLAGVFKAPMSYLCLICVSLDPSKLRVETLKENLVITLLGGVHYNVFPRTYESFLHPIFQLFGVLDFQCGYYIFYRCLSSIFSLSKITPAFNIIIWFLLSRLWFLFQ